MRRLMSIVAALFFSLTATSVWAQDGASRCGYGEFVEGALDGGAEAYRVTVPSRSYFRQDGVGCPSAASCQLKSYVIGKNQVLVSKVEHGWACAWYGGASTDTIGWLRAADLKKVTRPPPQTVNWLGTWFVGDDGQITITRDGGGLRVTGDATWRGPVSEHSGYFDGVLTVDGVRAVHTEPLGDEPAACVLNFRRIDRYLIVGDNGRCGGASVDFTSVYRPVGPGRR